MAHTGKDNYSTLVLAKLRSELKLADNVVFNNDYDGDATGAAVKIPSRDTEVAVSSYDIADGIAPALGATSYITMPIDKDVAVNEIIDGYDVEAVPDNLVSDRLDSAGYALAQKIDTDGGAVLLADGTAVSITTAPTKTTIYDLFVDQRKELTKANVPVNDRYALCPPETVALLLKSPEFISASALGDTVKEAGIIGRIAGFNVIEWNNTTAKLVAVFGHPKFATRANAFKVDVHLQDLSGSGKYVGASAVQGRMVYAHKVLRATAVRVVKHA